MALELEDRIAALTAELERAQARYDRQKANPAAHSGYEHTVYWLDLTKRKLAAAQAGDPDAWRKYPSAAEEDAAVGSRASRKTPTLRRTARRPAEPERPMEPFLRAARALRSFWEDGDSKAHTRLFETLIRDEYVIYGSSQGGGAYREHAVPLSLIRNHCFVLFREGNSDDEVGEFIKEHLKIVLVTKEEADQLDRVLGLRTKMPPGWVVGDDVMARFKAAGIQVIPVEAT